MNIDEYIAQGIFRFEAELRARHPDPEEAEAVATIAEHLSESLREDVESLSTADDGTTWPEVRAAMTSRGLEDDLQLALQARLASNLTPSFADAATRCWELADLLHPGEQPEVVTRFLVRVARCYLLGFVPECLVMCRGALENGINARYASEDRAWPRDKKGQQSMRARLDHAQAVGWLQRVSAASLHADVWQRGSKAAHDDPNAVGHALGAIKLTIAALKELRPPIVDDDAP